MLRQVTAGALNLVPLDHAGGYSIVSGDAVVRHVWLSSLRHTAEPVEPVAPALHVTNDPNRSTSRGQRAAHCMPCLLAQPASLVYDSSVHVLAVQVVWLLSAATPYRGAID